MIKSPISELRKRMNVAFVVFMVWLGIIFLRLVDLQILRHKTYKKIVRIQNSRTISIDSKRGDIFDRNGRILATSIRASSVYIVPTQWVGREEELKILVRALQLSENEHRNLKEGIREKKHFMWVKRKISLEEEDILSRLSLKNLDVIKEFKRVYPEGELASHVLGGVGIDEQGLDGIERFYDSILSGSKGKVLVYKDGRKVPREYEMQEIIPPKSGKDVVLTIDKLIQFITDKTLEKWVEILGAKAGVVIVMDPKNGEILSLSSYPRYDTNNFCRAAENSRFYS